VTQDELMAAIPNAETDIDLLDDVFKRFMDLKVDIVDNLDKDNLFDSSEKKTSKKADRAAISLSEISNDSIRMYLNEI